jgi:hypothetical protein
VLKPVRKTNEASSNAAGTSEKALETDNREATWLQATVAAIHAILGSARALEA